MVTLATPEKDLPFPERLKSAIIVNLARVEMADFLVDKSLIDEELLVSTEDAKYRACRLAKENGLLVGISSGANVLAAERWIEKNNPTGVVVTFLCDRGERYLSCM